MKLKTKTSPSDPRAVNRTLFYSPFNPKVNFAIEDPLLLTSNKALQNEGISYARYFGSGNPLSSKSAEFIQKRQKLEKQFSEKTGFEHTLITSYQDDILSSLQKCCLSSQIFILPQRIKSTLDSSQVISFDPENLYSLIPILENRSFDHRPLLVLPKIAPSFGRVNFKELRELKKRFNLFIVIEDSHTFGLEGLNGFGFKRENKLIDLLITHIPKNFGKMLTLFSGKREMLATLSEFGFESSAFFPIPAYLGMFSAALNLIESMTPQRELIHTFAEKIENSFSSHAKVHGPMIHFTFQSEDEKLHFYKTLVDLGFLLPWSTSSDSFSLTFHINYELEETSLHHIRKALDLYQTQVVCESI